MAHPTEGAGAMWRTADETSDYAMIPYHREILRLLRIGLRHD
jgi:hypothetical protein